MSHDIFDSSAGSGGVVIFRMTLRTWLGTFLVEYRRKRAHAGS